MCIIIDTNMFGAYADSRNLRMAPVRKWMDGKNGKIVYSPTGKIKDELNRCSKMRDKMDEYGLAGKLEIVEIAKVHACMQRLASQNIESDDPHIIALAQASGTMLLVTEDHRLGCDFKKLVPQGKIYNLKTPPRTIQNHRCLAK